MLCGALHYITLHYIACIIALHHICITFHYITLQHMHTYLITCSTLPYPYPNISSHNIIYEWPSVKTVKLVGKSPVVAMVGFCLSDSFGEFNSNCDVFFPPGVALNEILLRSRLCQVGLSENKVPQNPREMIIVPFQRTKF